MLPSCLSTPLLCLVTVLCLWNNGASSIFGRRDRPFCPPHVCSPMEGPQRTLPFGIILSREPLHDPAGKLQRCLSPCCFSFSLQKAACLPLTYLFVTLGSNIVRWSWDKSLLAQRLEIDHTFANLIFPCFMDVRDRVADCNVSLFKSSCGCGSSCFAAP